MTWKVRGSSVKQTKHIAVGICIVAAVLGLFFYIGFSRIDLNDRIAYFEMIGTWVGGLGVSIVGGLYTVDRRKADKEELDRREQQLAQQRLEQATELAWGCAFRLRARRGGGKGYQKIQITFTNKLNVNVMHPCFKNRAGAVIKKENLVIPTKPFGETISSSIFGIDCLSLDEKDANRRIKQDVQPLIIFEYTINGYRFRRAGNLVTNIPVES